MSYKLVLTAFLVISLASYGEAQTITGTVMDSTSNNRVAAAEVILLQVDSSYKATTDSTGKFRFFIRPGTYKLHIRALGYAELQSRVYSAKPNENISVLVQLTTDPLAIAPVYVLGRSRRPPSDVEAARRRARTGMGYFIDVAKEIDKWPAFDVTDLLRKVSGAWVSRNQVSFRGQNCDAAYLLDGFSVTPTPGMSATEMVSAMISPENIAAIEVYKDASFAPAELVIMHQHAVSLLQQGQCGLVAIWSKR
jgi:hypothetical protein